MSYTCFGDINCNLRSEAACLDIQLKSQFDSALAWFQFHTNLTLLKFPHDKLRRFFNYCAIRAAQKD